MLACKQRNSATACYAERVRSRPIVILIAAKQSPAGKGIALLPMAARNDNFQWFSGGVVQF